MAIGAIVVAWPSVRRSMETLTVPVQMEDLNVTIGAYAGRGDGRALMAAVAAFGVLGDQRGAQNALAGSRGGLG